MRIQYIPIFADIVRADGDKLAQEYHSVMSSEHHEFLSEGARARYAAVVHALGVMTDTNRFLRALAEIGADPAAPGREPPEYPVCRHCGSRDIGRDAAVRWDEQTQEWSLSGVFDSTICDNCGAESDDLCNWLPVEPPRALEPIVGARARILERSRIGGDRLKGREGEIVRQSRFGFYVRLDMTPRERVQKVELVEAPFLRVLSHPTRPA